MALVLKHKIDSSKILLITFTRLAAAQLRAEIKKVLELLEKDLPYVTTLHSFALRQILYNSGRVDAFPQPIRIADDWEERYIIQEDLKRLLKLNEIKEVRKLINQLSTDWETLRVDEEGWEEQFPNPAFLGAWRGHREMFGETLRAELVYQLKRQLAQNRNFRIDGDYSHILIDEYQDLNACDLAIVRELSERGSELFVAGDDDQSIYGFRYASPVGIRQFPEIYSGTKKFALEICFRCDKKILGAAEFVARLDPARLPKPTRARDGAGDGTVKLVNFKDQFHEAEQIAKKIKDLVDKKKVTSGQVAILLRNDRYGLISKPIIEEIRKLGLEVSLSGDLEFEENPDYRRVLAILKLIVDPHDSLALRTLLQIEKNGVGVQGIQEICALAQREGARFSNALTRIQADPALLPKFGGRVKDCMDDITRRVNAIPKNVSIKDILKAVVEQTCAETETRTKIIDHSFQVANQQNFKDLAELLKAIGISSTMMEQETQDDKVNILTMHQAKGLTFDICFVVGVEDEFIPGKNEGEKEGDERRLLYVSMTRARHALFLTYCSKRIKEQSHLGRTGKMSRNLSRFLRDSPLKVVRPT